MTGKFLIYSFDGFTLTVNCLRMWLNLLSLLGSSPQSSPAPVPKGQLLTRGLRRLPMPFVLNLIKWAA